MAHIPYYGEDLQHTQEKKSMILNYNQLVDHNIKMADAFIDLKNTGWKSYSKALNQYTFGFYSKQIEAMDETVDTMARSMKTAMRPMRGVC